MTDRKTQIKQAALSVFALYGLKRASMQDVAIEAGLSRPALYQYFRNKDDLIAACVDLVTEGAFLQADKAIRDDMGKKERIAAFLSTYMIYYHRLLVSGPHSDDVVALKTKYGPSKIDPVRKRIIERLNEMSGLEAENQIGIILTNSSEGLKMQACNEDILRQQIVTLVNALVPAEYPL